MYTKDMPKNECIKCQMSHKDPIFWDTHQTMSDNSIWCTKITRKDLNSYLGVYSDEDLDRID